MTVRTVLLLASLFFIIFPSAPLLAAEWYVDGSVAESGDGTSWDDAFKTIQEGINVALDGDTVVVAEGIYVENIRFCWTAPKGQPIFEENFDAYGNLYTYEDVANAGWTVVNGSGEPDVEWRLWSTDGELLGYDAPNIAGMTGCYMITDSDLSPTANLDEQLITPEIDCTEWSNIRLSFSKNFRAYYEDSAHLQIAEVDIRAYEQNISSWGNWVNLLRFDRSTAVEYDTNPEEVDLSIYDGTKIQIRWHFYDARYDYWFAVDNIRVSGNAAGMTPPINDQSLCTEGKNITVRSTDPLDPAFVTNTVIDGGQWGPVVTFVGTESETCVLSGFTIRNGEADRGGGICGGTLVDHTHATIRYNAITSNSATWSGGGLAFCDGVIRNNTIAKNSAGDSGGGLVFCNGTIRDNNISGNSAGRGAGGVSSCCGTIQNNIVSENSGGWLSGGLSGCNGVIENNIISGNSGGQFGGGLLTCDGTIRGNLIAGNYGAMGAGACWCDGTIENNTIVYNTGTALQWCRGTIRNCIIWGNTGPQLVEFALPTYSCIQDWTGGGQGNIADQPTFVDPGGPDDNPWTWGDNDFRLSPDSPCVDAGENEDWMREASDLYGNMRILYGLESRAVDMGAYEYSTGVDTDPPYVCGLHPALDATCVDISGNIVFHLRDPGNGVDETSIVVTVNGLEVIPTITGAPIDYTVSHDPPLDFAYGETVLVTVNAVDLSSPPNVMERVTYSFTTMAKLSPEATWYVNGSVSSSGDGTSWETAFKEIQQGIDAASDGHTVTVAQGTYVENINFLGKNIVLRSTNPMLPNVVARTVIDGNQSGPVVTFSGTEDERCVVSGFTLQNGEAENGGGICGGAPANYTHARIGNNTIRRNSASLGGGLAFCDGLIADNTITGNSADNPGGGISDCNATIQNNVISNNSSAKYGGGVAYSHGLMQNNRITGNSAEEGGGLASCQGTIQNNLISVNSAILDGAGLWFCGGTIRNNTIVENSAGREGGGLQWCLRTIHNCILWGNTATNGPQLYNSSDPTYSCIQGHDWGEGNISEDPQFADAGQGDYRLSENSPCIDVGQNRDWMLDATDLRGIPRIISDTVDMGAYEAPTEFVPPVITLAGDHSMTLECGTPYEEAGYTANDNHDGNITANVVVTGHVDHTLPGLYPLKYNVTDSGGNHAEEKTRVIRVRSTIPPVITLLGNNPVSLQLGTPYEEPGYTATDICDGDLTGDVQVTGSVDHNVIGSYILRYNVVDWDWNLAEEKTRTVDVVEAPAFEIVQIAMDGPAGTVGLTWNSRPGASYTVCSCIDLLAGGWIEEEAVPSGGETTTWTDPDTESSRKFYRIGIE